MKYLIEVPDDKVDAFLKVMDGLRKGDVVHAVQVQETGSPAETEKSAKDRAAGGEKTAYDFVEQYRDLVD